MAEHPHWVQSIPAHTRESGAILVFYVWRGNIKGGKKAAVTRVSIKEGWSSQTTGCQQSVLKTGQVLLLPLGTDMSWLKPAKHIHSPGWAIHEAFGAAAPCWAQPLKCISYVHQALLQNPSKEQKRRCPGVPTGSAETPGLGRDLGQGGIRAGIVQRQGLQSPPSITPVRWQWRVQPPGPVSILCQHPLSLPEP